LQQLTGVHEDEANDRQCCLHHQQLPRTKLDGGLQWLYTADDVAVQWLMTYGSLTHRTTTATTILIP